MTASSGFKFGPKSLKALEGVKAPLVSLANEVLKRSRIDFSISEGVRSPERQKQLVAEKKSLTLKSKHLTGDAIDFAAFVDGQLTWDKKYYDYLGELFETTAKELNINVKWGGRFKKADGKPFYDGPHVELV
jgi:peptidoglycan LD-endopeptidase CwlK